MSGVKASRQPVLDRRRAGVLLHPTSLPSGSLGEDATRFLDFLHHLGVSVWQMLPLGPVGPGGSPYSPDSAFAGNLGLIPTGILNKKETAHCLDEFRNRESAWLTDYALFTSIRNSLGEKPWWEWPGPLRLRQAEALNVFARANAEAIEACELQQYRFDRAWRNLREQAGERGILLFGDLPMFVQADSADVWANQGEFRLDELGAATHFAGVPPDAFSERGQCWGNPVYDWNRMRSARFSWWRKRLAHERGRFDLLRWDHFRGLSATWEIPARPGCTAADGQWSEVPGRDLLRCLEQETGSLRVVAENLGIITPEVEQLRKEFGLPGMHVLQFAFDGLEDNPHLPRHHEEQGVVYTGTHDNDTSLGWFNSLSAESKRQVFAVLGNSHRRMPDALVLAAFRSPCRLAVAPLQDLLGLGPEARMNTPGRAEGQWRWRFAWEQLTPAITRKWKAAISAANRCIPLQAA